MPTCGGATSKDMRSPRRSVTWFVVCTDRVGLANAAGMDQINFYQAPSIAPSERRMSAKLYIIGVRVCFNPTCN
jgi:hypothetical protein